MDKKEIRTDIKKIIKEHKNELKPLSEIICNKIINSDTFNNSQIILGYMALPDEVEINTVIKTALSQNKTVYLPHVFPETNKMEFYKYDLNTETTIGEYGISEPIFDPHTPVFNHKNLSSIEKVMVLVPGRAFTDNGDRLGRGKGFYDIYFNNITEKNITMAGICFNFQKLPTLPVTKNDRKMDIIFSD